MSVISERILEEMREVATALAVARNEANVKFASLDDDFCGFDENVESTKSTTGDESSEWDDYDVLPFQVAIGPPTRGKTRGMRVFDGVRFGRHSKRGAKTPRAKTAYHGG